MPRGKGIYDDEDTEEPNGGRPGPKDESDDGGRAADDTPDVAETDGEPTA